MTDESHGRTWVESLHRAIVADSDGNSAIPFEVEAAAADPDEFETIKSCLQLLEQFRREHFRPPHETNDGAVERTPPISGLWLSESSLADPKHIGRFAIIRELGSGGHGIVYQAHDPFLGRDIALKVPRPEALAVPEMRQRFLREARAAARLSHGNLIAVHEVGHVGPVCYIASEFCQGPSLARWLSDLRAQASPQPVPAAVAAEVVAQLADAVEHAHAAGVLHRDIKPGNVLLAPLAPAQSNGHPSPALDRRLPFVPKLTDFGLARWEDSGDTATRTGAVIGTPAYMAPEQIEGHTHAIAVTADVYALGAMLYEMLTGQTPFVGATTADILRRALTCNPAPIDQLRSGVSRELQAVCLKCLEKDPRQRYSTAGELAADLRRYLQHEPTVAQPLGRLSRARKWIRRRPAAAALLAVSALSLLSLFTVSGVYNYWLDAALTTSEERRNDVEKERQAVTLSEKITAASRAEARLLLYDADIKLADEAFRAGRPREAEDRLRRYLPQPGEEDLREFAWRYLWARCHERQRTLRGHQGAVYWATYSHDEQHIASCSQDGTIRIWDARTAQCLATWSGHEGDINSVSYSPDDKLLASSGDDGAVRLWDVKTGRLRRELERSESACLCVQFSPDGKYLAAAGKSRNLDIWRAPDWSLAARIPAHTDHIEAICFSPDGQRLASGGADQYLRLWDMDSQALAAELLVNRGQICSIAYSPDGLQLASGQQNGQVMLHDSRDLHELRAFSAHHDHVLSLSYSADGQRLMTAGRDSTARLWDLQTQEVLTTYYGHPRRIWHVELARGEAEFLTCSSDQSIKVCKLSEPYEWLPQYYIDRGEIGFNKTDEFWAVSRWRLDSQGMALFHGQHVDFWRPPVEPSGTLEATFLAPGGAVAWTCDNTGRWNKWTPEKGWTYSHQSAGPPGNAVAAVSHCGNWIACAADHLSVRDTVNWQEVLTTESSSVQAAWCKFSPDSHWLAVGFRNGTVRWWNLVQRAEVTKWPENLKWTTTSGAFSPDAGQLALACDDGHVRLLDASSGKLAADFTAHRGLVKGLAFSTNGRNLTTTGADRKVRVWDLRTLRNVLDLSAGKQEIQTIAFSPDGCQLVGVSQDDAVFRWSAPGGEQITHVNRFRPAQSRANMPTLQYMPPQLPPALPIGEPERREDLHQVLRQWCLLSMRRGVVLRPTFDDQEGDDGTRLGGILLPGVSMVDVSYTAVRDNNATTILSQQADLYAQQQHLAAYPFYESDRVNSLAVLPVDSFERISISEAELEDFDTPARLCCEIHRWAKRHGYAGGFPTFAEEATAGEKRYAAILIKSGFGEEQFIPATTIWPTDAPASP